MAGLEAVTGYIPSFEYNKNATYTFGGATAAITGGSLMLGPDAVSGVTFHNVWTGTLAGAIKIEASSDPRALQIHPDHSNADWFDITTQIVPTDPTTSGGSDLVQISDIRFEFIRLTFTSSAGAGDFKTYFSGHGT
jgi:hypothetical protein